MGAVEIVVAHRAGRALAPACRRLLARLLRDTGRRDSGVTLLLASEAGLRRLNRRYLGKDRATDVLAFPAEGDLEPGRPHLGEIAISVPRAARQARRARWRLGEEMSLLVVHGFLHLIGYDHVTDDGTMRRLEKDLLRRAARVSLDRRALPWGDGPAPGPWRRPRRLEVIGRE
jgi:probable rRNA maturation factor